MSRNRPGDLLRKLHWSVLKRIYRLRPRFAVYRRLGSRWLLDNRNWVDQQLIIRRPYEVAQLARCRDLADRHRISHFFDIGANFGLYSVLLSGASSIEAVEAFEPLPRNVHQLSANLYLNELDDRVTIHSLALSDQDARMELFVDGHSTGVSTLNPEGMARDAAAYDSRIGVQTRALDSLTRLRDTAVLVKIDVEGAELQVLEGMQAFLAGNRVWLQIETTPDTIDKVETFMRKAGYTGAGRIGADSYYSREPA